MIFVTGGAGFIGSNFVLDWLGGGAENLLNIDSLTYAGNLANLSALQGDARHVFVQADIGDGARMLGLMRAHRPRALVHFAAETHVDRSIEGPGAFIRTNINGSFALLEAARAYWSELTPSAQAAFRFLHVSTDEVYGSLGPSDAPFSETSPHAPNSPYSASKAAADHLVRAYHHTYGLPTLTVNCSNNYGPLQFPEKLIPLTITHALAGRTLPLYGDGGQVRDWLYVLDHCAAIRRVLEAGRPGQVYNVGGGNQKTNLEVMHTLCDILDREAPRQGGSYRQQIAHVADRPGHDRRYAIDAGKIAGELGWRALESFDSGIRKTVRWYLDHQEWSAALPARALRIAQGDGS